ncbi:hypothetical protein GQ651_14785 [Alphaproteobacteria bacterium GH1-50]|uniref:DUF5666 domain-containing protein n=1 Tax=Kangsaoukella pontilimi TaxID=2691042 RepID=A0A7C9MEX3_9RHOB|nr:hypothetical protein [Kangsaoukella pontilimi]MXQ09111.1 hypothetical protein [Kangsaoukella pontilimi]
MRLLIAALVLAASPAVASDSQISTIKTFDAQTGIFTLTDNTVWHMDSRTKFPADLASGDRVAISFLQNGDDGIVAIWSLARL